MEDKLESLERRYEELGGLLGDPSILSDPTQLKRHSKAHAELHAVVETYRKFKSIQRQLDDTRAMLKEASADAEMRALAAEELEQLQAKQSELELRLRELLIPKDPNDAKNVVIEIRAGAGGDEATLFAADLFRMYTRYAEGRGWKVELISAHPSEAGGFKEVIAIVSGDKVYSRLKHESGVHRVQRVPATEASGRIHTSTVTVAVLPEAEEVDVEIGPDEIRKDTFCSSGPGGQSVNTTYSAIRITHLPTGLVVQCQDEKSQHKNFAKALRVLRSRLLEIKQHEQHQAIAKERRGQIGSGDRAEKIRTYNFREGRVSDHRINLTIHRLSEVLEGDLDPLLDPLIAHDSAEKLKQETAV
ncbi:MAG TPA: peptide chain release factor 1 [Acidobacteriota bacterium]